MFFASLFFIIELLVYFLIKDLLLGDPDFHATILIGMNMLFVIFCLLKFNKKIMTILLFGFFIRICAMYWDIYAFEIFKLPHSGADSVGFYESALVVSSDLSRLEGYIYGGLYSKVLGVLLYLGPVSRITLQYLNILVSMFSIILIYKTMVQLMLKPIIRDRLVLLMILFPSSIIFSSILLREAIIAFLVTLSLYIFMKWVQTGAYRMVFLSTAVCLLGALFHSGVISLVVGYMIMILFYKPKKKIFKVTFQTFIIFAVLLSTTTILTYIPLENIAIFDKFTHALDKNDDISTIASTGSGGSVYLVNIAMDNPLVFILFAPIKMFYFIASPVPLNWRGLMDIITFFYDSIFYIILFIGPLFAIRKHGTSLKKHPIILSLIIILLVSLFIFGISLNNAGTAMRHRYKFFFLFILLFGLVFNVVSKNKEYRIVKNENLTIK